MPASPPQPPPAAAPLHLFIAASLAMLSLPGVASLALTAVDHLNPSPSTSYRDTADGPSATRDPVVHHTLQRAIATTLDTLRRDLFAVSPDERVIMGRDGWLYLAGELTPYFNGSELFKPATRAQSWVSAFARLASAARAQNVPFAIVIAAEKQSVIPEFLPAFVPAPHRDTRTDQLVAAINHHHRDHTPASLPFVDSRDILRTARRDREVYLRLDTHWNGQGALVVLDAALRAAGIEPSRRDLITATPPARITQRGDLAAMIGLDATEESESLITLLPPLAPNWNANGPQSSRVALASDGAIACACLTAASGDGTVVIFGDSFANTFWPALLRGYRYVFHFDFDNLSRFDEALALQPSLILIGLAERRLRGEVPTHADDRAAPDVPTPDARPPDTPRESLASLIARAGCEVPVQ